LAITGNLTLSNTSGSPFTINLVSLQNSSTPGLSTDWNQDVNFTNTFVTYTGTLGGTAFNANLFTVNTNGFQNPFSGTFSITNVSGGLALLYTSAFVPSSTYTWNAGSGLWGTTGNWTNGAAPTNGASIIFAGAAGGSSTNSSTVSSIQGLNFSNTAGSYTISGSALAVGAGGISNASTAAQTISNNLSLSANAALTAGAGNLTLAGNLTNSGNAVTVAGAANTAINGVISGAGSLTKSGTGSLNLVAANTYTGATTISAGTVVASSDAALGATNGSTTVADGAALSLSGGITSAENITISGSGVGGCGAIRSLGDGENTMTGTITLGGNARISVDAPIGSVSELVNWGTDDLTVEAGSTTMGGYSQTATTMTINTTPGIGDTLGGYLPVSDWNSVSSFGLQMSISGTNNNLPFSLAFYDSDFNFANTYTATTVGIGSAPGVVLLNLTTAGTGLMSAISGLQFTWDGGAAIDTTFLSLVSVPTSGLNVSGNISGGANVLTLGSATAGAGTVADGIRISGVISGSGNTYSNTTTSIVKDGGGTVYFSGNNTFTGDTRILDGILNIISGASTNALGVGSDLFISSFGTLEVAGNVSVSSIQGAGEGDTGNVQLYNNSALTVNGAGKTMTMAGDITGFGGLRVAGNTNTIVTLTGNNTYSQATVVNAGTLALAGPGGNQALRSTVSVTVGSSGKLLLQTSDQVRDNAAITLSGGTIQRAGGVSEVFGNLNLTTASFIDYGTGATGALRFGTYTPSSLLTVQNFLPGNKLQFGSTLTEAQLNNASLFSFSSGFTTGTEGGFFTITAIPEPSTYLAVAGLIALMLWPSRRRIFRGVGRKVVGVRG
jgi:autotransporter-associated beta strand protein